MFPNKQQSLAQLTPYFKASMGGGEEGGRGGGGEGGREINVCLNLNSHR